jgi:uncharacterized membrane protein YkoI
MKQSFKLAVVGAVAATAIAVGSVYAAKSSENDALALASAKIGLAQVVTAAEQHVGGKAAKAEYEEHKGQWVFDVEVVKDTKVVDVTVDAASGNVITAVEDKLDHDDDKDRD